MEALKKILALATGATLAYFKQYEVIFVSAGIVIIFDFITGLIASRIEGEAITSAKVRLGIWRKVALVIGLLLGTFLDMFVPYAFSHLGIELPTVALFSAVIGCYIIFGELISVLENLNRAQPDLIPAWVVSIIKGSKDKINGLNEKK